MLKPSLFLLLLFCLSVNMAVGQETASPMTITGGTLHASIGHDLPPWIFQYVPNELGVRQDEYAVDTSGEVNIYAADGKLIQSLSVSVSVRNNYLDGRTTITGLFQLKDMNGDGWKDLVVPVSYAGDSPLIFIDFFYFSPTKQQFVRVDEMSGIGDIAPRGKHCARVTYKCSNMAYCDDDFCYRTSTETWKHVRHRDNRRFVENMYRK